MTRKTIVLTSVLTRTFAVGAHFLSHVAVNFFSLIFSSILYLVYERTYRRSQVYERTCTPLDRSSEWRPSLSPHPNPTTWYTISSAFLSFLIVTQGNSNGTKANSLTLARANTTQSCVLNTPLYSLVFPKCWKLWNLIIYVLYFYAFVISVCLAR